MPRPFRNKCAPTFLQKRMSAPLALLRQKLNCTWSRKTSQREITWSASSVRCSEGASSFWGVLGVPPRPSAPKPLILLSSSSSCSFLLLLLLPPLRPLSDATTCACDTSGGQTAQTRSSTGRPNKTLTDFKSWEVAFSPKPKFQKRPDFQSCPFQLVANNWTSKRALWNTAILRDGYNGLKCFSAFLIEPSRKLIS